MAKKMTILSTEPQARKVLNRLTKIRGGKVKEKKGGIKQGAVTGTSPKGIRKTKAQGAAELAKLRAKQAARELKDVDSR